MAILNLRVHQVESKSDRNQLVKFPFRLYKGDPYWVAPLIGDRKDFLDPNKNPSFEYLENWLIKHILVVDMDYKPLVQGKREAREAAQSLKGTEITRIVI